jgi:dipeptide/tripeptide permease
MEPLGQENPQSYSHLAIWIVVFNTAFNLGYLGFQAVFSTYFDGSVFRRVLGLTDLYADIVTNILTGSVWFCALIGGVIMDTFWGKFRTLLIASVGLFLALSVELVGNVVDVSGINRSLNSTAIGTTPADIAFVSSSLAGVALFVVSVGFLKVSMAAFLGDQFNSTEQDARSGYFSKFYFSINLGALPIAIGGPFILAQPWGGWAFFVVLMASFLLGFGAFLTRAKQYRRVPPQGSVYSVFFRIIALGCCRRKGALRNQDVDRLIEGHSTVNDRLIDDSPPELSPLYRAKVQFTVQQVTDVERALKVAFAFLPIPLFYMVFYSIYSIWTSQAKDMDRAVGSLLIPPATLQALNLVFGMILIPVLSMLYPIFSKHIVRVTDLRKMALGQLFTLLAAITAALVERKMTAALPGTISWLWIIPQFLLVTMGEILLAVTLYEFAYTQAPPSMKGLMSGMALFCQALGNWFLVALQFIYLPREYLNFISAGVIAVVFVLFVLISSRYEYRNQDE